MAIFPMGFRLPNYTVRPVHRNTLQPTSLKFQALNDIRSDKFVLVSDLDGTFLGQERPTL